MAAWLLERSCSDFAATKLHQHRPQTATSIFPGKWSAIPRIFVPPLQSLFLRKERKEKWETNPGSLAGTRRNQEIKMEQNPCLEGKKIGREAPEPKPEPEGTRKSWWKNIPFLRKERKEKHGESPGTLAWTTGTRKSWWNRIPFLRQGARKSWWREKQGDKPRNPSRNQKETVNHDGTQSLSWDKKGEKSRETNPGTWARTRRNQEIMMEQGPLPEKRKDRKVGRQAPEPEPEPEGTRKSWRNTEQDPFLEKSRETSPGTLAGTRKKQKIMMEQSLFLGRIENPIQLVWGKILLEQTPF